MLHLYYKTTLLKQVSDVAKSLESSQALDISKIQKIQKDDVYLVEIKSIEKALLLHIKNLLSSKTDSLIYFFIEDFNNLMLFQLASFLKVKSIITPKHETSNVIANIEKDIALKRETLQNKEIADMLSKNISFMNYRENNLAYASKRLLERFDFSDLDAVESKLCSKIDLKELLEENTTKIEDIALGDSSKKYSLKSIGSKSDRYIFIEDILDEKSTKKSEIDFIKNRIYFIETLKDRLAEKNFPNSTHSIITINIENMENLCQFWSEYEIEMAIGDLLLQVGLRVDAHTLLAQYNNRLYIALFEGLSFEETKQKAQDIQTHILAYSSKKEIKPSVGLYALDINDFELNDALRVISDIAKESISSKDIEAQKIHRVVNVDKDLDDNKAINLFLQTVFTNKAPIKLLNIYKGLCINTASKIVKKTHEEIYVSFEHLQGTVMNFEKQTVLQSPSFTKDIEADVKLIDLKKRVALLRNFRFVEGSANTRKYSRVTSSQRTPISIVNSRGSLSGEILDISMNSIAIKTRLYNHIKELNSTGAELKFTLPIKSSEDGYMKLELDAKVTFVKCSEEYCKLVVDIEKDQAHESILMEYVYNRQKEIITELKKQTIMIS